MPLMALMPLTMILALMLPSVLVLALTLMTMPPPGLASDFPLQCLPPYPAQAITDGITLSGC
jgi:hypothetical protein